MTKNLKKVLFLPILGFGTLQAQQAINASGSDATGSSGSTSYSIGQIDYSAKGTNSEITEGVQQPYEIITLSTAETENRYKDILIYPNPVKDLLFVDFNNEKYKDSYYQLFDAQGKLIQKGDLNQRKNELNLNLLPQSVYIIQIYQNKENIKTFKIIKN